MDQLSTEREAPIAPGFCHYNAVNTTNNDKDRSEHPPCDSEIFEFIAMCVDQMKMAMAPLSTTLGRFGH